MNVFVSSSPVFKENQRKSYQIIQTLNKLLEYDLVLWTWTSIGEIKKTALHDQFHNSSPTLNFMDWRVIPITTIHVSEAFKTNSNNLNFDPLLNFQSASNDNYMHCLCTNICVFHTFCLTNECKATGNAVKMTVNVKMFESLYLYLLQYIISLTCLHLYVYLLAIIQCLFAVFSFNCFFFCNIFLRFFSPF